MPLSPITEARGAAVLRIDGEPALDVLRASAQGLEGQPLVLAVLAAAWFYPVWTAEVIPQPAWRMRMWFSSWI